MLSQIRFLCAILKFHVLHWSSLITHHLYDTPQKPALNALGPTHSRRTGYDVSDWTNE